jgi:hypothetical protein
MSVAAAAGIERVPRTAEERSELVSTKPDGWEYLLFASLLYVKKEELEPRWTGHVAGHRAARDFGLSLVQAIAELDQALPGVEAIAGQIDTALAPDVQERAFGKLGEEGDARLIAELADHLIAPYRGFLDWADELRADGVPEQVRDLFDLAAQLVDQPMREFRAFVDDTVTQLDDLPAALREGRPVQIKLVLRPTIDQNVQSRFHEELDRSQPTIKQQADDAERTAAEQAANATPSLTTAGGALPPDTAPQPADEPAGAEPTGSRNPLGKWRSGRAERKYDTELATWQGDRKECMERLELAQRFTGDSSSNALLLKRGEALFATVTGCSLVEDRRGAGHWEGRSSGFSIPVGSLGGRSIRYRTGRTRGHYVQGTPAAAAIDVGTMFVTNQRILFQGTRQTRECRFDKLIGAKHTPDGTTVFSVSNRQKPTRIHYGPELAGWFDFRLDLALAHFRGTIGDVVTQVQQDLAAIDAQRPTPPRRG